VRIRLVPVDVRHRAVGTEILLPVEGANAPARAAIRNPVQGMCRLRAPAPGPASLRPQVAVEVAAVLREGAELGVRDRSPRDAERREADFVSPFLVVEDERLVLGAAQEEGATGHSGVARPGARVGIAGSVTGDAGSGIGERLARVEERLAVHVLVKGRQAIEVARMVAERPARETG